MEGLAGQAEGFQAANAALERFTDGIVNGFAPLAGLDVNRAEDQERIHAIMQEHKGTFEFWAFYTDAFLALARLARDAATVERAMWATACAERCRAMMIYKAQLEEVVQMGHSARRIVDMLGTWDAHKEDSDEEFWQITFGQNSYVLSQAFAVPLVFIKDKAYVGGMKIDRSEARFVDYLFSTEVSREAILIEIKTPTAPLLGSEYRGSLLPSRELMGAVLQVLNYRAELIQNLKQLTRDGEVKLSAFNPRCAVIIGNAQDDLRDENARRSFELYRGSTAGVEVITYDELFRKVEVLADLFSLRRNRQKPA